MSGDLIKLEGKVDTVEIVTDIKKLRRVSRDATADDFPEEIAKTLLEALEIPREGLVSLGLSAPQLGYRLRMFVMKYGADIICLVNPVITKTRGRQIGVEMCLSLPGKSVSVERPKGIKVKCLNRYLKFVKYKFTGLDARVACHEIDHLDGRLIIDYE